MSPSSPLYSRYGVAYRWVRERDLELLRTWRNSPEISRFMIYRDTITEDAQARWFRSIDWVTENYSIVLYEGEAIGMAHVKDIDVSTRTAEGGIFIWSERHRNTDVPIRAALAGLDWNFYILLIETMKVRVLRENKRALRYNRAMGYVFEDPDPSAPVLFGHATRDAYAAATVELKKMLATPDDTPLEGFTFLPEEA